MRGKLLTILAVVLVSYGLATAAKADVKLPAIFGDHMIVQRDMPLPVWGWADPEENVTVTLGNRSKTATADSNGKWSVKLDALKAGGPYVLKVQGKNAVQRNDVLVGEVWLGSGQSNMAMTVGGVLHKDAEIAAANYPKIRVFTVSQKTAEEPKDDCAGQWQVCSPKTVSQFSAAAYFFGRELHKQLKVPIGMINSSWGGTPIQGWTSISAHQSVPQLVPMLESLKRSIAAYDPDAAKERYETQLAEWQKTVKATKDKAKRDELNRHKLRPPQDPRLAPGSPGRLFNAMIAPLAPYAIRGAIWYQGEANAGGWKLYGLQLRTMITEWRALWNEGEFPFLFVQLPNFGAPQQKPVESTGWARIREQFFETLSLPNTGMAVTIDVGEPKDIHPKNKQEVGRRLAQWTLAKTYGKKVVASGPLYKSMRTDGNKIVVEFDYLDGGLAVRGDKLKGFAIAGADKKFVWADAKIVGNTLVATSPKVKSPAAVRYAWANNPDCNLINKAGLPASPFRTDDWSE